VSHYIQRFASVATHTIFLSPEHAFHYIDRVLLYSLVAFVLDVYPSSAQLDASKKCDA
jgi:hypothetical protein